MTSPSVLRIAAFSHDNAGGNPAGVVFCDDTMPTEADMLRIAAEVGYSETAFLKKTADAWRIRYFSPEQEVPFCGHATVASGAALGERFGTGTYRLTLNDGEISVNAEKSPGGSFSATLQSPSTWSAEAPAELIATMLDSFSLAPTDLDPDFPIRIAFAGAKHLILVLRDRATLTAMDYPFEPVKKVMRREDLITISLLWRESDELFHARNAFAFGGVFEDPATGAAAAALAGYLRDIQWHGNNEFVILQGEDMGCPSRLLVRYGPTIGEGIDVTGETRHITDAGS